MQIFSRFYQPADEASDAAKAQENAKRTAADRIKETEINDKKMGRVHIYAGDGKGKTTASVGLTVRAAARGRKVIFSQFLKSGNSAELKVLRDLPTVKVVSGHTVNKFSFQMNEEELAITKKECEERITELIKEVDDLDMIVFDEALGTISAGVLDEDVLADFLINKPYNLEVVITGRNPSDRLIELADYYSEICMRKHPYETCGLDARPGIEF